MRSVSGRSFGEILRGMMTAFAVLGVGRELEGVETARKRGSWL